MPVSNIVNPIVYDCNSNPQTTPKYISDEQLAFDAAVTDLHAILCETVTCAPGFAGVVWARYHEARDRYGFKVTAAALNRFAATQKPGAA